ncbi:ATP-binding protein [Spirilliplanes yamanashiensis]|uniref:Histidine kinase/HSP90-like ATPase domain-containing protein n=1 Tax=Spirilliplanes yamanashiensis TaxID=42233 RepID=A0A8J3YDQ3_9ACTN|nr:ATP-binding protein [Spirilliplanes yamanashiensis]MDP9816538.1 anti-sigma regulatory factor (Ser/Thr protein kinase) [Spirilliplanes yamanashiensis]GIJ06065.1 hypothetical protein Sya03_54170 [Spirilliplanes yamanashiensis]
MDTMRSAPLPDGCTVLDEWTLDSSAQLTTLRAALHRSITGGAGQEAQLDEVPEKVAVVATELATNALRHGLPPTVVRLLRDGDRFILDVTDHDPGNPPDFAEGRAPGQGGLGLLFARELSLDVAWYAAAEVKHVWATFPAP